MRTLANPDVAQECCARLSRLDPSSARRWGLMTAHQMICHLNDAFKAGLGEKTVSVAPSPLPRKFVKWVALRTSLPWAHNVPTRPEMKQGVGGTPPGDWEQDREQLRQTILSFATRCRPVIHPIFGVMTEEDWQIWGYRHVDHHLRQFGV